MNKCQVLIILLATALLSTGCTQHIIDFVCEVPGEAIVYVGEEEYLLPATITFHRSRKDLRMELPRSGGQSVKAKSEIIFNPDFVPRKIDEYARLRAIFTEELIETVHEGNAAVFTGSSASDQRVFDLYFGKE